MTKEPEHTFDKAHDSLNTMEITEDIGNPAEALSGLARDEHYMKRALELARKGAGWVNPNPMVGAVIVKDGKIIGEGWHTRYGELHAERQALANCTENTEGATIYVTLEPCCHTGKTPPCTEALIEAKFARVVCGAPDPNPLVAGKGFEILRQAGIEVTENVLLDECLEINEVFFHYIRTKTPYVILKYAMTLDGKIATRSGKSKWITSEAARKRVHEDRHRYSAIMVGVNTVIKDDPLLTCRLMDFQTDDCACSHEGAENEVQANNVEKKTMPFSVADKEIAAQSKLSEKVLEQAIDEELEQELLDEELDDALAQKNQSNQNNRVKNPIRIICDTHLRTPLNSQIVQTAISVPTYIATTVSDINKHMPYREMDVDIIVCPLADGHVDMAVLFEKLGALGIDSVIVEGGAEINWSVLAYELVNKVQTYIAPKIFGGSDAPSPVAGLGVEAPKYAFEFKNMKITQLGPDVLLECEAR